MHHDTLDLNEAFNQIKLKWNFNLTKPAEAARGAAFCPKKHHQNSNLIFPL